jgi:photosystem II stability/assembly factor-like uncharacterized protein
MKRALLPFLLVAGLAAACSGHGREATAAAPTSAPPSTGPAVPAHQVPAGFVPTSATFISDRAGWVLGSVSCSGGHRRCALVARTTDGGVTWREVSRPPGTGEGELRFADARDGFLLDDGLLATHDGGRTWRSVDTLRDAIHEAWSAEAARGQLWLTGRVDHGGRGLWVGSVRSGSFDFAPVTLPDGDGTDLQLALHGPAVALTFLEGGAPRLEVSEDGDTFTKRVLPCPSNGPLAMRTTRVFLLVCAGDGAMGLQDTTVSITHDAGRSWRPVEAPEQLGGFPLVTPDALFVVSYRAVQVSRDAGSSWSRAFALEGCGPPCGIRAAGFEGARLGFLIEGTQHGAVMRLTRDDGRTWHRVDFRRTS